MKIKLLFLILVTAVSITNAQKNEGLSLTVEMTPYDFNEIPTKYSQKISAILKGQNAKELSVYTNQKKNVFYLTEEKSQGYYQYKLKNEVWRKLEKNKKLKAFIYDGEINVINKKGKIIKTFSI